MRLILLRHGKAEKRNPNLPDAQRRLTEKGRRELDHDLPALSHYLMTQPNCTIWSSDLARASETADILVRHMPGRDYDTRAFIGSGDSDALINALKGFEPESTLVLVGHEPYLRDWVQILTGRETRFSKSEFKMLYLNPEKPRRAVLLSRAELDQLDYLEPLDMPVAVGMRLILRRQHDRIVTVREAFLEDPDDSVSLHMLRVNLRILRSLFSFVKPWADRKTYKKTQKAYRALYHELGHLREIDVLLGSIHDSRNWELQPLILSLLSERNSEALRLSDLLSSDAHQLAYADAFTLLSKTLSSIHTEDTIHSKAPGQMKRRFRRICRDMSRLDFSDLQKIHGIRINCKTYRYLYERFSALASFDVAQRYLLVRKLHRLLGDYTDADYNIRALEALFEPEDIAADVALSRALQVYRETARAQQARTLKEIQKVQLELPAP